MLGLSNIQFFRTAFMEVVDSQQETILSNYKKNANGFDITINTVYTAFHNEMTLFEAHYSHMHTVPSLNSLIID